jgi:hypothetical protein
MNEVRHGRTNTGLSQSGSGLIHSLQSEKKNENKQSIFLTNRGGGAVKVVLVDRLVNLLRWYAQAL